MMSRNKRIFIFVRLITYAFVLSDDLVDWRITNASHYCPNNNICGLGPIQDAERMCCGGCYCDEDCKRRKDCCFNGGTNIKCIKTAFDISLESFYMETSGPNFSSAVQQFETTFEPCRDDRRPEWLQIFPVYSKSARQIFINRVCAESHRVYDYDEATLSLMCGVDDPLEDSGALIYTAILSIQNNVLPPWCSVHFRLPKAIDFIKASVCNENVVEDCSLEYIEQEPDNQMSRACQSDLHAIVYATNDKKSLSLFKNTFCAVCNNYTILSLSECLRLNPLSDGNNYVPVKKFTFLVDTARLNPYHQTDLPSQNKQQQACLKLNGKLSFETCRPILCPWGRVRDATGTCVWLSRFVTIDRFLVTLKLTPNTALRDTDLDSSQYALSNIHSPWPKKWKLGMIEYIADGSDSKLIKHLFVSISINESQSDVEEITKSVEVYSVTAWTLLLNGTLVNFTSVISETDSSRFGYAETYWKSAVTSRDNVTMVISSLHFCRQVQLSMSEFNRQPENNIIISILTNRQYHEREYMFVSDNYGPALPRICLNGSGFVDVSSAVMSRVVPVNCCRVVVMNLWILISILYLHSYFY